MKAEGWYVDPFAAHDGRWFSDGIPTSLVRDGLRESHDAPPDTPFVAGDLVSAELPDPGSSDDLLRAGSAERPYDSRDGVHGAFDLFDDRPRL